MTDDLTIPTFLRRGHPDCKIGSGISDPDSPAWVTLDLTNPKPSNRPPERRKLTAAFKSRVAMAVIAQVRSGADTFGKIRKALPDYDDRELKSGIRYAEKWMPMLERRGSKRKPIMHQYQARIERDGRRYRVVTY
jgi:hypothetical protein